MFLYFFQEIININAPDSTSLVGAVAEEAKAQAHPPFPRLRPPLRHFPLFPSLTPKTSLTWTSQEPPFKRDTPILFNPKVSMEIWKLFDLLIYFGCSLSLVKILLLYGGRVARLDVCFGARMRETSNVPRHSDSRHRKTSAISGSL